MSYTNAFEFLKRLVFST